MVSRLAADRLRVAGEVVAAGAPGSRVLVVGATRGAADDLVRAVARTRRATFGVERLSVTQLAARTAMLTLAQGGRTVSTALGAEAVAARAAFEAQRAGALRYFAPVAGFPGFPRALVRTLQELRLASVSGARLTHLPLAGPDLADLLDRFEACFDRSSTADRTALFETATGRARAQSIADTVVLLDPELDAPHERAFIAAVIAGATTVLITLPAGDRGGRTHAEAMGARLEDIDAAPNDAASIDGAAPNDLACLRRFLFSAAAPAAQRLLDGSVELFSAPGEGRECVEVARRLVAHAKAGIGFDEMAILVRAPQSYAGLLDAALARAGVPAWFDRGTRRPHPAGRAFLALLACAAEQFSAARFAEYLSLGQVPSAASAAGTPAWTPPTDEAMPFSSRLPDEPPDDAADEQPDDGADEKSHDEVAAGTLRAPWRWERLLVDSAVIREGAGRQQDAGRWRRRLAGHVQEVGRQIDEAARVDGEDDSRVHALRLVREQLETLRGFALPVVECMTQWPREAPWGEWLDRFEALMPAVLRRPASVLRVLADLRPMATVGPVDLGEVRRVLNDRLLTEASEPPARRYGRVFVGTPEQARGRSFRVVCVPGLAERVFPQRPREDALLLDALRALLDASLTTQRDRLSAERLRLQLAVGAASERLHVSYPRIELSESRARVPSFYALDVMRAATGVVPDHESLQEHARAAGDATLAWPAPTRPEDAIDDQEHDLSVLRTLLDEPNPATVKGHAHYLLKLNDHLRRSVIDRWARGQARWSPHDGLTRVTPHTAEALAGQRLTARPYSLSALQRFTACPYQFALSAMYRLRPFEPPQPLQLMDPLTRGSLFHEVQAHFFRTLDADGRLPVTPASVEAARLALDAAVDEVAGRAHEDLAPAVERVWEHEVAGLRRDLRAWLDYLARDGDAWLPTHFEYAFGSVPGQRDTRSRAEPVTVEGGFLLRGAVDLIEAHRETRVLRVTDHKTGRKPDRIEKAIVGGGAILQPVLYPMVVEAALGQPVSHGRLFYCTAAGSFHAHEIPLNDRHRQAGLEVLQVVDRAVERGWLAAAPTEEACGRCEFGTVCGTGVHRRIARKPAEPLADLLALRSRP